MLNRQTRLRRTSLNWLIIISSVGLCALLSFIHLPNLHLLVPDWFLIWVVVWSVKRSWGQGVLAGIALGWIQDGLVSAHPSHAVSLALVGGLTALMQKQRFVSEDFISVALITFAMAILQQTVIAIQMSLGSGFPLEEIWQHHRQVALSSAIMSSLWAPLLYAPLNRWWTWLRQQE
ncbi:MULTISPECIES: rod shape-determining protein MreD [unclassified Thermosynechococcus]|uniref:rod shape-determining protein MreD n=1 Tax=unclassified Thermosynechococcus TaxID=2622553 RepID=UPI0019819D2C|nr:MULTISPECIES: rod shape-determining protein MreD [unclassified Thermosynechococcus]QSF50085.1 rod shape-determining protein MreD [Thermosynechococcus sp. TA-1]WNC46052.1 rod shape-determining protein MreD [Thermosynechococcus sp. GLH187]WNC48589.1 rod shape-determining protein MreD [Thermosynechococcus sp. GLH333]WNC51122.1 rod shape-determining protein MreD [Thermosynechococcus sp. GLH87]WNC58751.1 rod shape-determining protein MreD [Thermosynechococcus sp. TG218]